jgi:hypothetical protein
MQTNFVAVVLMKQRLRIRCRYGHIAFHTEGIIGKETDLDSNPGM